jgi:CRP/FNR family cyclic AMP-dependent transcriptional regulator
MSSRRIELLQQMPVFGALREDSLTLLLGLAQMVTVPAGGYFFREHDQADSMYVLESGRVAVIKTWRGEDFVLHTLAAGDCFGEMALMDLHPRSASVRADAQCHALQIGADGLMHLYERDVEQFAVIQMNIGREVCRRLRATDEMLFQARMGGTPFQSATPFRAA